MLAVHAVGQREGAGEASEGSVIQIRAVALLLLLRFALAADRQAICGLVDLSASILIPNEPLKACANAAAALSKPIERLAGSIGSEVADAAVRALAALYAGDPEAVEIELQVILRLSDAPI